MVLKRGAVHLILIYNYRTIPQRSIHNVVLSLKLGERNAPKQYRFYVNKPARSRVFREFVFEQFNLILRLSQLLESYSVCSVKVDWSLPISLAVAGFRVECPRSWHSWLNWGYILRE